MTKLTKEELRIASQVWDRVFGQVYDVESMDYYRKREGKRYTVKHSGSDEWTCNCPSFIYKTGTQTVEDPETGKRYVDTCKHIRFCMEKEGVKYKRVWR